jgi:hypothetical protein
VSMEVANLLACVFDTFSQYTLVTPDKNGEVDEELLNFQYAVSS